MKLKLSQCCESIYLSINQFYLSQHCVSFHMFYNACIRLIDKLITNDSEMEFLININDICVYVFLLKQQKGSSQSACFCLLLMNKSKFMSYYQILKIVLG